MNGWIHTTSSILILWKGWNCVIFIIRFIFFLRGNCCCWFCVAGQFNVHPDLTFHIITSNVLHTQTSYMPTTLARMLSQNQYGNTACIFIDPHSNHWFSSFLSAFFLSLPLLLNRKKKRKKCPPMFSCLFGHQPSDPFMDFAMKCSYVFIHVFFVPFFSVGPFHLFFLLCILVHTF